MSSIHIASYALRIGVSIMEVSEIFLIQRKRNFIMYALGPISQERYHLTKFIYM